MMKGNTSKGLRITILILAISQVLSGLFHMFSPQTMLSQDQAIERVLGGAMLAFALGAGLTYLERAWDRARIAVLIQVTWMILYTITLAWGVLTGGLLVNAAPSVIIGAFLSILLTSLYIREERLKR
ncbi:MAG: hypothetical protein JXB60_05205 [Candidatus Cloacimonetes bacterium]|nr:hypothetical protein [Candidatus Cloacimonadota bacterium]